MPVGNFIRGLRDPPSWADSYPAGSSEWFYVNRETGQWNPDGKDQEGAEWALFWKHEDGTWWEKDSWGDESWQAHAQKWCEWREHAPEAVAPTAEEATAEAMAAAADKAPEMLLLCFIDCSLVHSLMSSGG